MNLFAHITITRPSLTFPQTGKLLLRLIALAIAITLPPAVAAESKDFYLGLSYNNNEVDIKSPRFNDNESSGSEGLTLGYYITDWMAVELAYQPSSDTSVSLSSGENGSTGYQNYQANYKFTSSLSLLAQYNFKGNAKNWAILGKLGLMQGKGEVSTKEITDAYWLKDGERYETFEDTLTEEEIRDLPSPVDDEQAYFEALLELFDRSEKVEISTITKDDDSEIVPVISTGFRYTCKRESFPLCPEWLVNQLGFSFDISYFKLQPELFGEKHDVEVLQQSLGLQWYFY